MTPTQGQRRQWHMNMDMKLDEEERSTETSESLQQLFKIVIYKK